MKTRCINLKDFEAVGLLDGSITALWRPLSPQPMEYEGGWCYCSPKGKFIWGAISMPGSPTDHCPWQPGDALICREKHSVWYDGARRGAYYWADQGAMHQVTRWKGAQQMPQWASRIRRELVAVECRQPDRETEERLIASGDYRKWHWVLTVGEVAADLVANCILDHSQPCTCGAEEHNIQAEAALCALETP